VLDDGTQYIYGAGLVSHITSSGSFYYLADGLGSTMAMVDSTGAVVQTYDYDAFGSVRSSTGTQSTEFQFAALNDSSHRADIDAILASVVFLK